MLLWDEIANDTRKAMREHGITIADVRALSMREQIRMETAARRLLNDAAMAELDAWAAQG